MGAGFWLSPKRKVLGSVLAPSGGLRSPQRRLGKNHEDRSLGGPQRNALMRGANGLLMRNATIRLRRQVAKRELQELSCRAYIGTTTILVDRDVVLVDSGSTTSLRLNSGSTKGGRPSHLPHHLGQCAARRGEPRRRGRRKGLRELFVLKRFGSASRGGLRPGASDVARAY